MNIATEAYHQLVSLSQEHGLTVSELCSYGLMKQKSKPNIVFQYPGGKLDALKHIYPRFGQCKTFVEPFGGRADLIVNLPDDIRQYADHIVYGDISANLVNFWQATKNDPVGLARMLTNDIKAEMLATARNNWLIQERLKTEAMLAADPDAYDLKKAAYYCYCQCIIKDGCCTKGKRNATTVSWSNDVMVYKNKVAYFKWLSEKWQGVEVLYRHWRETIYAAPNVHPIAILFDPPYSHDYRAKNMYEWDDGQVAAEAAEEAELLGGQKGFRIAFCGMKGEHHFEGWERVEWKSTRCTRDAKECIWFSPGCLKVVDDKEAA